MPVSIRSAHPASAVGESPSAESPSDSSGCTVVSALWKKRGVTVRCKVVKDRVRNLGRRKGQMTWSEKGSDNSVEERVRSLGRRKGQITRSKKGSDHSVEERVRSLGRRKGQITRSKKRVRSPGRRKGQITWSEWTSGKLHDGAGMLSLFGKGLQIKESCKCDCAMLLHKRP
jgi:hypothetical protein